MSRPQAAIAARYSFRLPAMPWRDRAGRFSRLKAATLFLLVVPGVWILASLALGRYSALATEYLIEETGAWGIRILILSLAVTPLRRILDWAAVMQLRRMVGVGAFVYLALHLCAYILDQKFDLARVATEIVLRTYLTIGFVGLSLLAALAATSTDAMIKRLGGRRWRLLHRAVYLIGALAILHQSMQFKLPEFEPTLLGAAYAWLMLWRASSGRFEVGRSPLRLALLSLLVALGTALGEAIWIHLATGADATMVLRANLDFEYEFRPAWYVLAGGLAVAVLAAGRGAFRMVRRARVH